RWGSEVDLGGVAEVFELGDRLEHVALKPRSDLILPLSELQPLAPLGDVALTELGREISAEPEGFEGVGVETLGEVAFQSQRGEVLPPLRLGLLRAEQRGVPCR